MSQIISQNFLNSYYFVLLTRLVQRLVLILTGHELMMSIEPFNLFYYFLVQFI